MAGVGGSGGEKMETTVLEQFFKNFLKENEAFENFRKNKTSPDHTPNVSLLNTSPVRAKVPSSTAST